MIEQNTWVEKEKKQIENSALRFILLGVIKKYSNLGGLYGYAISEKILEVTQGELDATNATFYAILRRMEQSGLIFAQIGERSDGPPRKHYFITNNGELAYNELKLNFEYYHSLVSMMIYNTKGDTQ
ncbi:MAG: PadR family transcriptional regulator [Candidatus Heimdallarchaeota archaeon]|nr:PadR family transcriptional regulator [Candidatus Heimdallarchaeota archaeon]